MIRTSFDAMGTTIEIMVERENDVGRCRELFDRLESRLSRFIASSELSTINRSERLEIDVSATMAAVLASAQEMRLRTDSMVDPAVGAAIAAWGYDRTFAEVTNSPLPDQLPHLGSWSIAGTKLVREAGVKLDLGGIAKGWAADRAVDAGLALLVSAGGDIRSAIEDAQIELVDPWDQSPATVTLGTGGLATSSVTRRRWIAGDRETHHIIDPATMSPARSPILSTSATCATATEAEAAAKAVLLMGRNGLAWADQESWIDAAMAVWHDGSVYATKGWEVAA